MMGGDFRQVLPVIPIGSKVQIIVQASLTRSLLWNDIQRNTGCYGTRVGTYASHCCDGRFPSFYLHP
jgi:hypothetical protein